MVTDGLIAMPRQVIKELSEIAHPDLPGAWAPGMRKLLNYPIDTDYSFVQKVLAVTPGIVDPSKTSDDADPWVVAQALALIASGNNTTVVTEDNIDRASISILTACGIHQIPCVDLATFLNHCGIQMLSNPGS